MTKYNQFYRKELAGIHARKIHPVWRGIGCILMVLIPVLSYAGAVLLVQANQQQGWLRMPPEFLRTVTLPLLGSVPHLVANLGVALLLILAGFAFVMIVYTLVYRFLGPSRYAPPDFPPIRGRRRRLRKL